MLYKITTSRELSAWKNTLSEFIYTFFTNYLSALESDGCVLLAETMDDVPGISNYIDMNHHPCEEIKVIGTYLSAMYLTNNEYSVLLALPLSIAPDILLDEL